MLHDRVIPLLCVYSRLMRDVSCIRSAVCLVSCSKGIILRGDQIPAIGQAVNDWWCQFGTLQTGCNDAFIRRPRCEHENNLTQMAVCNGKIR